MGKFLNFLHRALDFFWIFTGIFHAALLQAKKRQGDEEERLSNIQAQIEECTQAVENGKNEIIELLNSRATTRGKAQRFDTMMEQIDIRRAGISQRQLHLKTEEAEQHTEMEKAREKFQGITSLIEEMNAECQRLDDEVHKLTSELKQQNSQMEIGQSAYHREASRLESLKNITERYDGYGNSIRRVMDPAVPPECSSFQSLPRFQYSSHS